MPPGIRRTTATSPLLRGGDGGAYRTPSSHTGASGGGAGGGIVNPNTGGNVAGSGLGDPGSFGQQGSRGRGGGRHSVPRRGKR